MEPWETLTMSRKEVPRAGLVKMVRAGKATNPQRAAFQISSVTGDRTHENRHTSVTPVSPGSRVRVQ
jgi:hypothetical protein